MEQMLAKLNLRNISKVNIFKLSLLIAAICNFDKIILLPFSFINIHDGFDIGFLFAPVIAEDVFKYGLVAQTSRYLCGINSSAQQFPFSYTLISFLSAPHISYLIHSFVFIFIGFLGMFLLLRDDFELSDEATFLGALFFVSVPPEMFYTLISGIPLLIWALERVFDIDSYFYKKLLAYIYTVFYFFNTSVIFTPFSVIPFYFSYFFFISKAKKNIRNIITFFLLLGLYMIINLPVFVQMFFQSLGSQRISYNLEGKISWIVPLRDLISNLFSIDMTRQHGITVPSLLGIFIILYWLFSIKLKGINKKTAFILLWIAAIELFSFFIYPSPFWHSFQGHLGFLRTFQFQRLSYILVVPFSILIGIVANFLIDKNKISNNKAWIISLFCIFLYSLLIFKLRPDLKIQLYIQFFILCIFLVLLISKNYRIANFSVSTILLVPFTLFLITNSFCSRIINWDTNNFYHFFNSEQIEEIKKIEKDNLQNFRVAKVGGYHPGQLLFNGFYCADGYSSVYPQAYKEFWAKVIEPELTQSSLFRDYFLGYGNRVYLYDSLSSDTIKQLSFNPELLKLINVKYLFSSKKIIQCEKYGLLELIKIKEPSYSSNSKFEKFFKKAEFYVYQNETFAPPVFLTGSIELFDNKNGLLSELGRRKYDYLKEHTFALRQDLENLATDTLNISGSKIINYTLSPDCIFVKLSNQHPLILNWTRNYDTNWVCLIDGKKTKIFRIYNCFMGVILPAGSQSVEFCYRNVYLNYSYIILITGLIFISIFMIWSFSGHSKEHNQNARKEQYAQKK